MKKILIAVATLIVAAVALSMIMRPTAQVATVVKGRAFDLVPGSVIVQAEFQTEVKSEIGGRVIRSELDEGEQVAAGATLVQVDTGDTVLEIEQIQSDYDAKKKAIAVGSAIKLDLETAREDLANYERLTKTGNYPVAELEKQRRKVKAIEQKLKLEEVTNAQAIATYENTLKVKRREVEKMRITAPFPGTVSKVFARPGDLIDKGSPIAILISTGRTVEARINEENFSGIRPGQKASVRFLGYGNTQYDATVTKVLPTADPETQRYIVHLDVKIEKEKLIPGITGEVSIEIGARDAQAIAPRRALFGSNQNVYVVESGRVKLRRVKPGYVSLVGVEILEGLKAGDKVIVDQLDRFRDGERVRIEEEAPEK